MEGKTTEARQRTYAALARGTGVNDILDALVDAADIIIDLHDVGEYGQERVGEAEQAINASLQAIEDKLAKSETKFNLSATVGPVGLKGGNILSLVVTSVLRSVGIKAVNLSKTQTALELLRNSEQLGADLVVPLLPRERVEEQLRGFLEEFERGGFGAKFETIPLATRPPDAVQVNVVIARNSAEAISKVTEWALKKERSQKPH